MKWLPRTLVDGLGFPEGPVLLDDGRLVFTDIRRQCIWVWDETHGARIVVNTGGGPNGAALGADGALYVANNGGLNVGPQGYWRAPEQIDGRIQRVAIDDGTFTDLIVDLPGDLPHRPNDICFGPDGALYFTDPANWEDLANLMPGRIWRATLEGKVEQVAEVPNFCNGLAFGPDGRLYVAQSIGMKVVALDLREDGLGDPTDFAILPVGFPDGFCFATDGRMIVCGSMGDVIQVFDAEGSLVQTLECGEHTEPTNCCLADGLLFVTLSAIGQVVALDVDAAPLPLHR